jgi:Prokaryotic RING finger family 1
VSPAQQGESSCPYCLCALSPGEPAVACSGCGFVHHRECWDTLGGCAVEGCTKMVEVKKAEVGSTFWGATEKVCPMCSEKIPVAALDCPYCKAAFKDMRPMAKEDVLFKAEDPVLKSYRKSANLLLIFSLIGCTSPLALLVGGIWYARKRGEIQRAGTTTRAKVLVSLGVCVIYLVMIGVGTLVFSISRSSQ